MENFWQKIKQRGIALAPMEDVTDTVFRQLMLEVASEDNLDIVYSEFVSTDGLCHPIGHDKVVHRLEISEEERALLDQRGTKIIAQVWGKTPEKFADAIREHINPLGFDGIISTWVVPYQRSLSKVDARPLSIPPPSQKNLS